MTMVETNTVSTPGRFEVRVTAESHLAWLRTRLSVERTMMSWIRTAVSLIGFGFAIQQFFERLGGTEGTKPALVPAAPKYLGAALITCGVLVLAISIFQYLWTARYLRSGSYAPIAGLGEGMQSPVVAVAILLACIGLFALGAVLFRLT